MAPRKKRARGRARKNVVQDNIDIFEQQEMVNNIDDSFEEVETAVDNSYAYIEEQIQLPLTQGNSSDMHIENANADHGIKKETIERAFQDSSSTTLCEENELISVRIKKEKIDAENKSKKSVGATNSVHNSATSEQSSNSSGLVKEATGSSFRQNQHSSSTANTSEVRNRPVRVPNSSSPSLMNTLPSASSSSAVNSLPGSQNRPVLNSSPILNSTSPALYSSSPSVASSSPVPGPSSFTETVNEHSRRNSIEEVVTIKKEHAGTHLNAQQKSSEKAPPVTMTQKQVIEAFSYVRVKQETPDVNPVLPTQVQHSVVNSAAEPEDQLDDDVNVTATASFCDDVVILDSDGDIEPEPEDHALYHKALESLGTAWADICPFADEVSGDPLENNFTACMSELDMFVRLSIAVGETDNIRSNAKMVSYELRKLRDAISEQDNLSPDGFTPSLLETIDFDEPESVDTAMEVSPESNENENLEEISDQEAVDVPNDGLTLGSQILSTEFLRGILENLPFTPNPEALSLSSLSSFNLEKTTTSTTARKPNEATYSGTANLEPTPEPSIQHDVRANSPEEEHQFDDYMDVDSPEAAIAQSPDTRADEVSTNRSQHIDSDERSRSPPEQIPAVGKDFNNKTDQSVSHKRKYDVIMERRKQEESRPSKRTFRDEHQPRDPRLAKVCRKIQLVNRKVVPVIEPMPLEGNTSKSKKGKERSSSLSETNDCDMALASGSTAPPDVVTRDARRQSKETTDKEAVSRDPRRQNKETSNKDTIRDPRRQSKEPSNYDTIRDPRRQSKETSNYDSIRDPRRQSRESSNYDTIRDSRRQSQETSNKDAVRVPRRQTRETTNNDVRDQRKPSKEIANNDADESRGNRFNYRGGFLANDIVTSSERQKRSLSKPSDKEPLLKKRDTDYHELHASIDVPGLNTEVISNLNVSRPLPPPQPAPFNSRDPRQLRRRLQQDAMDTVNVSPVNAYPIPTVSQPMDAAYSERRKVVNDYNHTNLSAATPNAIPVQYPAVNPAYFSSYMRVSSSQYGFSDPTPGPADQMFSPTSVTPPQMVSPPHSLPVDNSRQNFSSSSRSSYSNVPTSSSHPVPPPPIDDARPSFVRVDVNLLPVPLKDSVGVKILSPLEALQILLTWNVEWLDQNLKNPQPPPIVHRFHEVKYVYKSYEHYFNSYFPCLFMETWTRILGAWKPKKTEYKRYDAQKSGAVGATSDWNCECKIVGTVSCPEEGDLVMLVFEHDHQEIKMFGYVKSHFYFYESRSSSKCFPKVEHVSHLVINTMFRIMTNQIKTVRVSTICSLRASMNQIEALHVVNATIMLPTILHPKMPGCNQVHIKRVKTTDNNSIREAIDTILDVANLEEMLPHITIVHAPPFTDLGVVVCSLVPYVKTELFHGGPAHLLICARGIQRLKELGIKLAQEDIKVIILATTDQLHQKDLEQLTLDEVARRYMNDSKQRHMTENEAQEEVLKQCDVVLSLVTTCVESSVKTVLGRESATPFNFCILDEAYYCTEPETLVPLCYGIKKFIFLGDQQQQPALKTKGFRPLKNYKISLMTRLGKILADLNVG